MSRKKVGVMAKRQVRVATPRDFTTDAELCALKRDNLTIGDYWMLVGNSGTNVVLTKQKIGEMPSEKIELPRRIFDRFVDWYNTGETGRKRR